MALRAAVAPTQTADPDRFSIRDARAQGLIVGVVTVCLLLPVSFFGVAIFDEGFIVTGGMDMARGAVPYRDFYVPYGPGQYGLTAVLFKLFGEHLGFARILHAVTLGAIVALAHALTLTLTSGDRWIATLSTVLLLVTLLAMTTSAGYPAITALLCLFIVAVLLKRWILRHRLIDACAIAAMVAAAATFRWDFGAYGLVATTTTLVGVEARRPAPDRAWHTVLAVPGLALAGVVLVYGPLIIMTGPVKWTREVLVHTLFEFPKWRNLEVVRPLYRSLIVSLAGGDTARAAEILFTTTYAIFGIVFFGAPVILCIVAAVLLPRHLRDANPATPAPWLAFFLSLLCGLLLQQLRIRPHYWQAFPAFCVAALIGAYVCRHCRWRYGRIPLGVAAAVLLIAGGLLGANNYRKALMRSVAIAEDRADYVRVPLEQAYYPHLIRYIRATTDPREAIFSGVRDTSRLFVNDSLLYFLTGRVAPGRFAQMEPGIANTEASQRKIIESLRTQRVQTVILLDLASDEPNLTATSNGVHVLDGYIRTHYVTTATFGPYQVMNPAVPSAPQRNRKD